MQEHEKETYIKITIGLILFAIVALAVIAIAQDPAGAHQALTTTYCDARRCY